MTLSVLLTGGLGYVGGRLAIALTEAGHIVHCGTRRADTAPPAWLPSMRMVRLDWESSTSLAQACRHMDCVIHLAGMNEVESSSDPLGALRINGSGSLRLLEAAKASGVRRFVYFSTAHVYGSPLLGKIDEATVPRPAHPYSITHKVAEDFVLAAHDKRQLEGIVFRLSNGFGAPVTPDIDRWSLLVNDLCRQAAMNGELRLNTSGEQLRDFVTLGDVARAVNHVLALDSSRLSDGLFNLGGGMTASILQMTEKVAARWQALTGHSIAISRPPGSGNPAPHLDYCSDKLNATGFVRTANIDGEIDDTLQLCRRAFPR